VGGGFTFQSATVTEVNQDSVNGKYVRVQGDGASWVYLHLSDNSLVKVGQELKGGDMPIGADGVDILSRDVLGRPADPGMISTYQQRTDWKGVHDELAKQPEAANYRKKIQDGFTCLANSGKVLPPGKYIVN
jgi:hypothetical protein